MDDCYHGRLLPWMISFTLLIITHIYFLSFSCSELDARQSKCYIDKDTVLLVISDPIEGIGSGGATLNALLVITEHLAAQAGYTVRL